MGQTVKPYSEEGSKKEQVEQMFDNVAFRYDFLNRFLTARIDQIWRRAAIKELLRTKPKHVLDMATGTGDMAIMIAKNDPNVTVTGVDLSAKMLEIGREKIAKQDLSSRIEMIKGDAEKIVYDDNTFDGVCAAFGVRNYENLALGLTEMRRVLKKDGKIVILEFSKPTAFPFKHLYNFYFKRILPAIGKLQSKDDRAYTYLYESVQNFPDRSALVEIMQSIGYRNCQYKSLSLGICHIYSGIK